MPNVHQTSDVKERKGKGREGRGREGKEREGKERKGRGRKGKIATKSSDELRFGSCQTTVSQ